MIEIFLSGTIEGKYKRALMEAVKSGEIERTSLEEGYFFQGLFYYGPLHGNNKDEGRHEILKKLKYHTIDEKKLKKYPEYHGDEFKQEMLEKLMQHESVRVWYDEDCKAIQLCDLYYIVDYLQGYKVDIYIQKCPILPQGEINDKEFGSVFGVTDFSPMIDAYLHPTKAKTEFMEFCSKEWKRLLNENTGLRIYKEGKIVSVDECYYDDYLQKLSNGKEIDFNKIEPSIFREVDPNFILHRCIMLGIYHPFYLNNN